MDKKDGIDGVFKLLDDWKSLPNYQLERRADIYFAYYLPMIMNKFLNPNNDEEGELITESCIIPEFPVRKTSLKEEDNRSFKIDYVVFGKRTVYFVELKTDIDSFDSEQYRNLYEAREIGVAELIMRLSLIHNASIKTYGENKCKYGALQERLYNVGIVYDYKTEIFRKECSKQYNDITIIYIQPICDTESMKKKKDKTLEQIKQNNSAEVVITFKDVIEALRTETSDDLASRFCKSLQEWEKQEEKKNEE